MTTRHSPFGDQPFSVADGGAAGLGRGALAGPTFEAPFRGVRQWKGAREATDERSRLIERCRQYAPRMPATQFFSHDTALVAYGAPTPYGWELGELHVSVHRPLQAPRARGIRGHRLQGRVPATRDIAGLRLEDPARGWVQLAHDWPFDAMVAAGDFLVARRRPLVTVEELRTEAAWARRERALGAALAAIRVGSESPEETRLRLVLLRGGLPEPELNIDIFDDTGRFLGRGDLVFPRFKVLVEYDGRQHASDPAQFARDADRWHGFAENGWTLVRILRHHLRGSGDVALDRARSALLRAGWRPSGR